MLHSRDFQGHRASVIFRTSAVQSRRSFSYPFSAIAERTEAAASALDSGIYRYPPVFDILIYGLFNSVRRNTSVAHRLDGLRKARFNAFRVDLCRGLWYSWIINRDCS